MKRFDKRKLVAEFRDLRKSIKKKLSDAEIMNEIKKSRQA
jgi:hypothetical protein